MWGTSSPQPSHNPVYKPVCEFHAIPRDGLGESVPDPRWKPICPASIACGLQYQCGTAMTSDEICRNLGRLRLRRTRSKRGIRSACA